MNQMLVELSGNGAYPDVLVADWNGYAKQTQGWYQEDDVHLSTAGAFGVADFISRKVAYAAGLPCPMPRDPGGAVELPCPDPDASGPPADVVALYAGLG